jgi:hypothetical protein
MSAYHLFLGYWVNKWEVTTGVCQERPYGLRVDKISSQIIQELVLICEEILSFPFSPSLRWLGLIGPNISKNVVREWKESQHSHMINLWTCNLLDTLCLEVTFIQLIICKRSVGSYLTNDWTHGFHTMINALPYYAHSLRSFFLTSSIVR